MQTVIRCRISSCDRLSQASCTRCRNSAMVMAGSWERESSRFIMSQTCSIGERSRDVAGQGNCCTQRRARCVAVAVCGCALSWCESTSPFCRRNVSSTGLTTWCSGHCLLYSAETPTLTASCNTTKPEVEPVCRGRMYYGRWRSPGLGRTFAHRHWRQQSAIPLSSRLFHTPE